jgi:hypothetical protein
MHTHVGFTALPMVKTPIVYPGLPGLDAWYHGSSRSKIVLSLHLLVTVHFVIHPLAYLFTFFFVYLWANYPPPPSFLTSSPSHHHLFNISKPSQPISPFSCPHLIFLYNIMQSNKLNICVKLVQTKAMSISKVRLLCELITHEIQN